MTRITPAQRLMALALLTALTALSGVIPVLDLMVGDGGDAVEAQHHPETHGFPHNHLICIQHQANHWVSGSGTPLHVVLATVSLPSFSRPGPSFHSIRTVLPPARAPPLA